MLKNVIGVLLLLLSITACTKSPAESAKPAKSDYVGVVNDFADQIPFEVEHDLSEKIMSHEQMTGNQVRIVITKDLKGEPLSNYAFRKFNEWEVGKKGIDNGVLIAIDAEASETERRSFIATGMEIEGERITDAQAGRISRNTIRPLWNSGQKGLALSAGLDSVIALLGETPLERMKTEGTLPVKAGNGVVADKDHTLAFVALFLFIVFIGILVYVLGRGNDDSDESDYPSRSYHERARRRSSEDSGSSFSSYISDSGSSWSGDSGSSSSGDCGGGGCDGGGGGD